MRSILTWAFGLFGGLVSAQQLPLVDITLFQTDVDQYEVRVRPDGPFNGLFHSYLFTLRWSAGATATGLDLEVTPTTDEISLYPVLSGTIITSNGYKYAPYTAETIVTMSSVGQSWVGGEEIAIATVQVLGGTADLVIADDDWTNINNGAYYLSLNGYERQGVIYSTGTGVIHMAMDQSSEVRCTVNGDMLDMTMDMELARDLRYDLVDIRGRVVAQGGFTAPTGTSTTSVTVGGLAPGSYAMRLRAIDRVWGMHVNIIR